MTITNTTISAATIATFSLLAGSATADTIEVPSVTTEDCDVNQSGRVEVNDIIDVLGDLGNSCNNCRTDVDDSRKADVNDLLHVLARYGAAADWGTPVDSPLNGGILVLQNNLHSNNAEVHQTGMTNAARAVSSYCLSAHGMQTPEGFEAVLNTSEEEIRDYLAYNAQVYGMTADTTEHLVLDIEGRFFSPMYWGTYLNPDHQNFNPEKLDRILDAFALRIAVAREMFPNAKLSLWDLGSPHPFGMADLPTMAWRTEGFLYAGEYGVYDELDYSVPMIYQPWGVTDAHHHRNLSVIDLGIATAGQLTKSDGSPLEMMPMISLTIFNGDSNHDRTKVELEDLANSISRIKSHGVDEYMIWNGEETLATPDSNSSNYEVTTRLHELAEVMTNAGL